MKSLLDTSLHSQANLLVVFLLVELYKLGGARSSEILCSPGRKSPQAAEGQSSQPGRHDLVRLLREALATDRSRKANYLDLVAAHLVEPSASKANERVFKMLDLIRIANQLATIAPEESNELGSIEVNVLSCPGRAIFVTEELIQALRSQQEVLIR